VFDESVFPFATLHPHAGAQLRAEISLLSPDLHLPMIGGDDLGANVDANPTNHVPAESVTHESDDFLSNNYHGTDSAPFPSEETRSASGSLRSALDHVPGVDPDSAASPGHAASPGSPLLSAPDSVGPVTVTSPGPATRIAGSRPVPSVAADPAPGSSVAGSDGSDLLGSSAASTGIISGSSAAPDSAALAVTSAVPAPRPVTRSQRGIFNPRFLLMVRSGMTRVSL
jgi:hypothetical protein